MTHRLVSAIALALATAVGCAPAAAPPAPAAPAVDTAGVTQALRDLNGRANAAEVAGSAADYAALFTENGRIDYPGLPPLVGRAAIEEAAKGAWAESDYTAMNETPNITVVVNNGLAYDGGSYTGAYTVKGKKPVTEYGRYVTAAVKGADGQWRTSYLMAFIDSTVASK